MPETNQIGQLDLNLLAVLDALFSTGSVTEAGKALGLSQSAMSHSLKRLRDFFDDHLFVKTGPAMVPTAKAESLRPAVVTIMQTVRTSILPQATFEPANLRRTFWICMSDMGELVFVPPLVERLRELAPHCKLHTLQVTPDQLENVLAAGKADLAIGSVRNASEGLFQQELFTHTFVCIVSPKNKVVGEVLTPEQFQQMPHIAVTLTGHPQTPYDTALEEAGVERNIAISTPHFLIVPLLIDSHPEFVATVPRALGTVFARHGVVRAIEPPVTLPSFSLRQYWHPRFHNDPAVLWLRQLVKQTFDALPASMR